MRCARDVDLIYVVIICSFLSCACGKLKDCDKLKVDDPRIVEFANKCASWRVDLKKYDPPEVHDYSDRFGIFYRGKVKLPGNFCTILIDRKTCRCVYVQGM